MKYIAYLCGGIHRNTLFIIPRYHKMYNQLIEETIFLQKIVLAHFLQYNMNCIKIALKLLSTKIKQRVATYVYVYDSLCARKCKTICVYFRNNSSVHSVISLMFTYPNQLSAAMNATMTFILMQYKEIVFYP